MTISFIDETEKTKDKQTQSKLLAHITKSHQKRGLRKQHHNKELLQTILNGGSKKSEETLPQLNKEPSDCPLATQVTERQLTSEKKSEQNVANNSNSTIIVSDFFGLKLDVDDFISTYEMILAQTSTIECKGTK